MQFQSPRARSNNETSLLPLTNIVFLLMIFFLLIGRVSQPEAFSIQPPKSNSQAPVAAKTLRVEISRDGRIAVNGQPVERDQLAAIVRAHQRQSSNRGVRLKADGRENATRVVRVMRTLHEAGVEKLRLVTHGR